MTADPRAPVFDVIRERLPDLWNDPGNILVMDNLLDAFGFPRAEMGRSISQRGLDLIKEFEGLELRAYQDSAGVWTIGVGHTKGVKPGQAITEAQADAFLREDVAEAEAGVRRLFPVTTQSQFDALTSFVFNLGAGNAEGSTLRRKHNAGDIVGAKAEFSRWVYAGGQRLRGLERRRDAEAALYGS